MKLIHLFFLLAFPFLCKGFDIPVTGSGFKITLERLDSTTSIKAMPVMGSVVDNDGVFGFPVAKGSLLAYNNRTVTGCNVFFTGGIQFSKLGLTFTISNIAINIDTRAITASLNGVANSPFGTIDINAVKIIKAKGITVVSIVMTHQSVFQKRIVSAINDQLKTNLREEHRTINCFVSFDVDLALGSQVNTDLVRALGLEAFCANMDIRSLDNTSFDVMGHFLQ